MKKILFAILTIIIASCLTTEKVKAQTSFVLSQKMTLEEIVINYKVCVFPDNFETKKLIVKLAKVSPNKFNFFILCDDNNVITYYLVFLSDRTHTWHMDSLTGFKCLNPGVRVFSSK